MGKLPVMSTLMQDYGADHHERASRKYEAQITRIILTNGREEITEWVFTHGTFFEAVWWNNMLREAETGQRFTNAEQEAVWGHKYAQAIRVAGLRLQEKLVKAFLVTNQEYKKQAIPV
jgi:hypothetical protein